MATTARAVHNIEIPPADDMDMHSDAGIDFGDGDIELDMETAPAVPHHDDDMSIQDAASVTGQDGLTSLNEQDDFMADNEDLIEEDIEYHEEDHVVVTDHPSVTNDTVNQNDASAAVDEDLVDYSDDEDNDPQVDNAPVDQNPSLDDQDVEEHREYVVDQASEAQDASGINQDINIDQRSLEAENVQHNAASQQSVDSQRSPDRVTDPHDSAEETYHSEEEDGEVPLQDPEGAVEPDHEQYEDHNESAQDEHDYQGVASNEHTEHQDHGSPALQPVTVNYAGNELWLFKDHDHDESGDWLLEDMNLAKSTMSDLFHACRSSLGDDVSHEHEIGFRFDHLHNLELYEDNTACVAVSLERLVELYHTLQTQDDNHEPDCFYMSLLFRPRFATLLSDVAKYAEQGSGYSALNAAVAAGDTHFANIVSNASSDEPTEWDNEDSEDNNEDQSHDASPHDEEQHDEHSEAGSFGHEAEDDHSQAAESENIDQAEANHSTGWDTQRDEATDESHLLGSSADQHAPLPNDENVENDHIDESEKQYVEGDGDLVDYGDEEGAESNPQPETDVATSHSQSSSTVHGDDVGATHEDTFNFGFLETENQTDERDIPVPEDTEGNEPFYEDSTAYTNDDTAQSYQDYVGELQEGSFQDLQQEGVEKAVVSELDNDANQDFSAVQFHNTDHQPESDFMLAAEFNEGNTTDPFGDDFSGANDFLDIDHASEWIDNIEPASNFTGDMINNNDLFDANDGDEGGEAEATALASSPAADPVTAPSSSELKESSLQGQKRSIDEAGDGVDDALESTDAKRARV